MKEQIKPEFAESNKLIAEFMGMIQGRIVDGIGYYDPDELEYDSSWNWIMRVCYKIKTNQIPEISDNEINNNTAMALWERIAFSVACINIELVYEACLAYITWFNGLKGVNTNG